jgi:hypothetical protein
MLERNVKFIVLVLFPVASRLSVQCLAWTRNLPKGEYLCSSRLLCGQELDHLSTLVRRRPRFLLSESARHVKLDCIRHRADYQIGSFCIAMVE